MNFSGPSDPVTYNRSTVTSISEYKKMFANKEDKKVIGESSPIYLYKKEVPKNIKRDLGNNVNIIVSLRNPVDRAYSDFLNMVRLGRERVLDFRKVLRKEDERKKKNWSPFYHYASKGFYYSQVKRYMDEFGEENVKILIFEELIKNTEKNIKGVANFLGLKKFNFDTSKKHNASRYPKSGLIHGFASHPKVKCARWVFRGPIWKAIDWLRRQNLSAEAPEMSPRVRERLEELYRPDVVRLQELIRRPVEDIWFD